VGTPGKVALGAAHVVPEHFFVSGSWAANLDVKIEGEKFFHARQLMEVLPDMPEK